MDVERTARHEPPAQRREGLHHAGSQTQPSDSLREMHPLSLCAKKRVSGKDYLDSFDQRAAVTSEPSRRPRIGRGPRTSILAHTRPAAPVPDSQDFQPTSPIRRSAPAATRDRPQTLRGHWANRHWANRHWANRHWENRHWAAYRLQDPQVPGR
jgi:hypothetical protein